MLLLTDTASVSCALADSSLDLDLRALLGLRAWQLHVEQGCRLGERVRFVVVQGGDTPDVINDALGFPMIGELAGEPAYDWIEDHGLWFEIAYGTGGRDLTRVFVENGPATEVGVHYLCLAHFWPEGREEGQ